MLSLLACAGHETCESLTLQRYAQSPWLAVMPAKRHAPGRLMQHVYHGDTALRVTRTETTSAVPALQEGFVNPRFSTGRVSSDENSPPPTSSEYELS